MGLGVCSTYNRVVGNEINTYSKLFFKMHHDAFFLLLEKYAYRDQWILSQWKVFEWKCFTAGIIDYRQARKVQKNLKGYKEFYDTIIRDKKRLMEIIELELSDFTNQARQNFKIYKNINEINTIIYAIVFGIINGVICNTYLNITVLVIIAAMIVILRAISVFKTFRSVYTTYFNFSDQKMADFHIKYSDIGKQVYRQQYARSHAFKQTQNCMLVFFPIILLTSFSLYYSTNYLF